MNLVRVNKCGVGRVQVVKRKHLPPGFPNGRNQRCQCQIHHRRVLCSMGKLKARCCYLYVTIRGGSATYCSNIYSSKCESYPSLWGEYTFKKIRQGTNIFWVYPNPICAGVMESKIDPTKMGNLIIMQTQIFPPTKMRLKTWD